MHFETILPIPQETLQSYFQSTDDNKLFVVNLNESSLSAQESITYIGNTRLNIDLDLEKASPEKTKELFAHFLKSPVVTNVTVLVDLLFSVILNKHGCEITSKYWNKEFLDSLWKENSEELERWCHFYDNSMIYALFCIKHEIEDGEIKSPEDLTVIDIDLVEILKENEGLTVDYDTVLPPNVALLYTLENFFIYYFHYRGEKAKDNPTFFWKNYTEPMYNMQNLFYYFARHHNLPLSFLYDVKKEIIEQEHGKRE